jgi:hypothetical protein
MPNDSFATAVPAAIRRATQEPPAIGSGWTVRILTPEGVHELRLSSQRQVGRLALELERVGFVLDVDARSETDFVFAPETAEAR